MRWKCSDCDIPCEYDNNIGMHETQMPPKHCNITGSMCNWKKVKEPREQKFSKRQWWIEVIVGLIVIYTVFGLVAWLT